MTVYKIELWIISLFLLFCSCKKSYTPPPPTVPEGIYQGYDSALYVHDIYGQQLIGACLDVKRIDGNLYFYDVLLEQTGENTYKFDYTTITHFGIGEESITFPIRKMGVFKFSYNHLIVHYSVGIKGQTMSEYKFNGWR